MKKWLADKAADKRNGLNLLFASMLEAYIRLRLNHPEDAFAIIKAAGEAQHQQKGLIERRSCGRHSNDDLCIFAVISELLYVLEIDRGTYTHMHMNKDVIYC
jgi:hypothetical protein